MNFISSPRKFQGCPLYFPSLISVELSSSWGHAFSEPSATHASKAFEKKGFTGAVFFLDLLS